MEPDTPTSSSASSSQWSFKRIPLRLMIVLAASGLAMQQIEQYRVSRTAHTLGTVESKNLIIVPPNRSSVEIHGEEMIPIHHTEVTLVTAYYDFSSRKRSAKTYDEWIENMMTLKDNMIIFVPPNQVKRFQQLRDKSNRTANTLVVELAMNETTMYKKYGGMDFWEAQHRMDIERLRHSKEHYVVWNEKFEFVRRAMDLNPFKHSILYAWVDVGYFRTKNFVNQRMVRFVPKGLKANQVMVLNNTSAEGIGGGFVGGYKEGQTTWGEKYYEMIDLAHNTTFIGKEQPWMRKTCDQHTDLCFEVAWSSKFGDHWFHMAPYLHGMGYQEEERI